MLIYQQGDFSPSRLVLATLQKQAEVEGPIPSLSEMKRLFGERKYQVFEDGDGLHFYPSTCKKVQHPYVEGEEDFYIAGDHIIISDDSILRQYDSPPSLGGHYLEIDKSELPEVIMEIWG